MVWRRVQVLRPKTSTSGGQSAGIAEGESFDARAADMELAKEEPVILLAADDEDEDEAVEGEEAVILVNARHSDADVQVRHLVNCSIRDG